MESNKNSMVYNLFSGLLNEMKEHPENVSESDRKALDKIYSDLCKATGTSEHIRWVVNWAIEKWHSTADMLAGVAPYAVVRDGGNIVLDAGANEVLNLITGTGTPFSSANAKIYVGTDATAENAAQIGVIATGANRAVADMETGYPTVSGRTVTFRATFGEDAANFDWNEASITNGTGASSVALNRKVAQMGTKNGGTWTMQIVLSLVSA